MVARQALTALPENLLEMQIVRAYLGTTKSRTPGMGPEISALTSPPGESHAEYRVRTTGLGKLQ